MTGPAEHGPGGASPHDERSLREIALLGDAVLDEMRFINHFRGLGVPDDALESLAEAVTSRIDYAFAVTWSPDWVPSGRPHTWRDEVGWHARCTECLAESAAVGGEDGALAWFDDHAGRKHSQS
ncbi:hypothetical protein [Tsukamurella soli]|uniref:Uncharacterized protein n=1 Tax=Tsukamurella soli TaxID=644556 RepID=A0ABP8JHL2_9ACTN